jgi:hypothetical protein
MADKKAKIEVPVEVQKKPPVLHPAVDLEAFARTFNVNDMLDRLAKELKIRGFNTVEDLKSNRKADELVAVLQFAIRFDVVKLRSLVKEE